MAPLACAVGAHSRREKMQWSAFIPRPCLKMNEPGHSAEAESFDSGGRRVEAQAIARRSIVPVPAKPYCPEEVSTTTTCRAPHPASPYDMRPNVISASGWKNHLGNFPCALINQHLPRRRPSRCGISTALVTSARRAPNRLRSNLSGLSLTEYLNCLVFGQERQDHPGIVGRPRRRHPAAARYLHLR